MCERMDRNIVRNAPQPSTLIVIAIALVLSVAIGCSQPASTPTPIPTPTATPTPTAVTTIPTSNATPIPIPTATPTPQTRLQLALSWVPLEYADKLIQFSDHASSSLATGVPIPHSIEEYSELGDSQRSRLFEGTERSHPHLGSAEPYVEEMFNYSLQEYNLGVWHWDFGYKRPHFMVSEGISDMDGMLRGLAEQGFEETAYKGTPYWQIYEDYGFDIKRHPLRTLMTSWNRVAIMDNHILRAPATPIIENLIDLQRGESGSLLESPPHWTLSHVGGKGMIGGIFVTPDWIGEYAVGSFRFNIRLGSITTSGCCEYRSDALDMHLTGPEAWGKLSPYRMALFGYRVQDGVEETVIALHYLDPDAARKDARELEKRWNSFHLFVEYGVPVTNSCAPLSTRVEEAEEHSVLLATCPVIRGAEEDETFVPGPDLWIRLLYEGSKLEFLALDLEEQKQRAAERAKK